MKRLLVISYWILSILLVAICLSSLGYRFLETLFIGMMFLPGALAAKYSFADEWFLYFIPFAMMASNLSRGILPSIQTN